MDQKVIEQLDFIIFWRWEYFRRSSEFDMSVFIECDEDRLFTSKSLHDKSFSFVSGEKTGRDSLFYKTSDDILSNIYNDGIDYKYPGFIFFEEDYDASLRIFSNMATATGKDCLDENDVDKIESSISKFMNMLCIDADGGDYVYLSDFSKGAEPLKRLIDFHYELYKADGNEALQRFAQTNYYLSRARSQLQLKKIKINNEARAIGIWLHDYCTGNGCGGPTAFNALKSRGYLSRLGLSYLFDDPQRRQLGRLLSQTRKCIKETEVLAIS